MSRSKKSNFSFFSLWLRLLKSHKQACVWMQKIWKMKNKLMTTYSTSRESEIKDSQAVSYHFCCIFRQCSRKLELHKQGHSRKLSIECHRSPGFYNDWEQATICTAGSIVMPPTDFWVLEMITTLSLNQLLSELLTRAILQQTCLHVIMYPWPA